MSVSATIIGAIIAAATSITSSVIASKDAEKAQEESLRLANISRQDQLNYQEEQRKLNEMKLKLEKSSLGFQKELGRKQMAFQKSEAKKDRQERAVERGVQARQATLNNTLNLINSNDMLKNNFLNFWRRAA